MTRRKWSLKTYPQMLERNKARKCLFRVRKHLKHLKETESLHIINRLLRSA